MRNHQKFIDLPLKEKWIAFGKLQHIYSCSEVAYEKLNKIIVAAEKTGWFDDVKIFVAPEPPEIEDKDDIPNPLFQSAGVKN